MNKRGFVKACPNADITGTALFEVFDSKDQAKVTRAVNKYIKNESGQNDKSAIRILQNIMYERRIKEKYTTVLPLRCNGYLFTLYASFGQWRIGSFCNISFNRSQPEKEGNMSQPEFVEAVAEIKKFCTTVN